MFAASRSGLSSIASMTAHTRTASLLSVATIVVSALAACGGDISSSEGSDSCPSVLVFRGTDYTDARSRGELPTTKSLGMGQLPGCADAPGVSEKGSAVEVWQLRGVEPATALAGSLGGEMQLFVVEDVPDLCSVKYTRCR